MKTSEYSKQLKSIIAQEEGCVVLLNGPWGVGKTYFWNEFSNNEDNFRKQVEDEDGKQNKQKIAYVSLFGKKSIDEIQSEALVQIFTRNKIIDTVSKISDSIKGTLNWKDGGTSGLNLGFAGNSLGFLLSVVKAKSLKNNYICIDDFERKSNNLHVVEIMGYASTLSERYGCKVVLIMDESKIISGSESKIYEEYKEKLINFEIKFNPDQSDIIENMLSGLNEDHKKGILKAVQFANISNLRTIKKIKQWIYLLKENLDDEFDTEFREKIGYRLSLLAVIYFEFGRDGLAKISKLNLGSNQKEIDIDDKLTFFRSRIQHQVSIYSSLDKIIWNFFDNFELDVNGIRDDFNNEKINTINSAIRDDFEELIHKYTYDTTYTDDKIVVDAKKMLNENKSNILNILSLDSFLFIIDSLTQISKDERYFYKFKKDIFSEYVSEKIKKIDSLKDLINVEDSDLVSSIIETNSGIKYEYTEKIKELERKLTSVESIQDMLKRIPKNHGWNPQDEQILNSLTVDFLLEKILTSPGFLEDVSDFIRWTNSFGSSKPFKMLCDSAIKALNNLGEEKLGSFRYKRLAFLLRFNPN